MRDVPGRQLSVNGRTVYVEESGHGHDWVVFEAGGGCGRTCWDPVLPPLADTARLVAYDRAGHGLSGRTTRPLSIDDMAADLVAMTENVVPGEFVLVAHSMGGLVARRAAERLGSRLRGLLLVDPTPETSPVYDTWDQTARKIDRMLALTQDAQPFPSPGTAIQRQRPTLVSRRHLPDHARRGLHPGRNLPDPQGDAGGGRRHPRVPRPAASAPEMPDDRAVVGPRPRKGGSARTSPSGSTSAATPRACLTGATKASTRRTSSRPSSRNSSPIGSDTFSTGPARTFPLAARFRRRKAPGSACSVHRPQSRPTAPASEVRFNRGRPAAF